MTDTYRRIARRKRGAAARPAPAQYQQKHVKIIKLKSLEIITALPNILPPQQIHVIRAASNFGRCIGFAPPQGERHSEISPLFDTAGVLPISGKRRVMS
ncbi:hypothetical protein [Glycocaulis sp.]|uniref:hypothetical protein n=1 Tax=Glycocaulis sp. TaxID=1969725 RepID=UPI0025C2BC94|nr:hypothetical protein [Glycocaulis sp.]MCH8521277.1 hypothetical protein [Glycocaulis sp.]